MLRRLLLILIVLPVSVGLVVLAVANRHAVTLVVDPIAGAEGWSLDLPLFVLLFGAMIVGVVLGGAAVWFGQGRYRRAARRSAREARAAHAEVEALRAGVAPRGGPAMMPSALAPSASRPALSDHRDAA